MFTRITKMVVVLLLTASFTTPLHARQSTNPKMGINVGDLGKLTTAIPFTDIFKSSRGWFTSCEFDWRAGKAIDPGCTRKTSLNTREQDLLQLDGNGWVRSLPQPHDAPIFTSVTSTWKLSKHFPVGAYIVLFEGEGTIKITGDLKITQQGQQHIDFNLLSPKRNLRLQIKSTDPRRVGNYIRNIRIVPKASQHNYQRQVFNPDYLARIRPMHAIRFMPWTNTRGNQAINWNERATIGTAFYTGNTGVPAERMIDLANAIDATPWLSIPYKASDEYMTEYARMVKSRLRPNQKVYIEFSNEVWNSIFPAATYAARAADKLWRFPYKKVPQGKRRVLLAANWYAMRSVQMCQIWKREFRGQAHRVKCAVGTLNSVPWVGKEIVDCPLFKEANGCGRHVDAFGVGPYFGDYIARKENRETVRSWTRDQDGGRGRLFHEILHGGVVANSPPGGAMSLLQTQLAANKAIADKYNLEMVAYEAGQHLIRYDPPHTVKDPAVLNLFMNAQKDPRMQQAYQQYLQAWERSGGGLMLHFYGIGEPEPKNFFGMLDHLHQPSTPKYAAIMNYLGSPSNYVPPRKTTVPPVSSNNLYAEQQKQQEIVRQQQEQQRRQQIAQQQTNERAQQQAQQQTNWESYLQPEQIIQSNQQGVYGVGIQGWTHQNLSSVISPPIQLQQGNRNQFRIIWNYPNGNQNLRGNEFFRIYAVDHRGGRKLLLNQPIHDIRDIGSYDQLFEEDISRYVGPPIRLIIQVSPGLSTNIQELQY